MDLEKAFEEQHFPVSGPLHEFRMDAQWGQTLASSIEMKHAVANHGLQKAPNHSEIMVALNAQKAEIVQRAFQALTSGAGLCNCLGRLAIRLMSALDMQHHPSAAAFSRPARHHAEGNVLDPRLSFALASTLIYSNDPEMMRWTNGLVPLYEGSGGPPPPPPFTPPQSGDSDDGDTGDGGVDQVGGGGGGADGGGKDEDKEKDWRDTSSSSSRDNGDGVDVGSVSKRLITGRKQHPLYQHWKSSAKKSDMFLLKLPAFQRAFPQFAELRRFMESCKIDEQVSHHGFENISTKCRRYCNWRWRSGNRTRSVKLMLASASLSAQSCLPMTMFFQCTHPLLIDKNVICFRLTHKSPKHMYAREETDEPNFFGDDAMVVEVLPIVAMDHRQARMMVGVTGETFVVDMRSLIHACTTFHRWQVAEDAPPGVWLHDMHLLGGNLLQTFDCRAFVTKRISCSSCLNGV